MALTLDLEKDVSSELVGLLLDRDLAWKMPIDNLSLRDTGTKQVLEYRLEFRGGLSTHADLPVVRFESCRGYQFVAIDRGR